MPPTGGNEVGMGGNNLNGAQIRGNSNPNNTIHSNLHSQREKPKGQI